MSHSFATRTFVSILLLAGGIWTTWGSFNDHNLPFSLSVVDARTAVVHPNPGIPLPPGIQAGDRVDLKALDPLTRSAVAIYDLQGTLPANQVYLFDVHHGDTNATVPVNTVRNALSQRAFISSWIFW